MSLTKHLIGAVAFAGALSLAGCGGGNGAAGTDTAPAPVQSGQGIAVGEPNGAVPAASEFIARAQQHTCADQRNRMFMIDKRMVFWERVGSCVDNSYERTLFGAKPESPLCSVSDSIAGPRTTCTDEQARAMFDVILANIDKSDLGLGSGHQVETMIIPKP